MPDKKLSHKEVNYRVAISLLKRCSRCSMFIDMVPTACTLVESPIRPGDVCDRWVSDNKRDRRGG